MYVYIICISYIGGKSALPEHDCPRVHNMYRFNASMCSNYKQCITKTDNNLYLIGIGQTCEYLDIHLFSHYLATIFQIHETETANPQK